MSGVTSPISVQVQGSRDGLEDLRLLSLPSGSAWTTWNHHTVYVSPDELPSLIDASVRLLGEPTRMTSVPLYLRLAQAAREAGVIVLFTGEGADELFGGYSSYLKWFRDSTEANSLHGRIEDFEFPVERRDWLTELLGKESVNWCSDRFRQIYGPVLLNQNLETLLRIELEISLEPLLVRADHCLMSQGVEGRTPYLHGDVPEIARFQMI